MKFYSYIKSFLRDRKATIKIGLLQSLEFTLGPQETPQREVVSALLFILTMKGLSDRLRSIKRTNHAIYADDITVWSLGGSEAETEHALQAALERTESYIRDSGLKLSPAKSELLLYRSNGKGGRGQPPPNQANIRMEIQHGQTISIADTRRVLGQKSYNPEERIRELSKRSPRNWKTHSDM
ncbi:hypothetical protein HPB48_019862 [Haemaphysalis longicornis]|uniref:Reverse transcriptase domain-containing protein n=1 Tax=Haemaphysalis longicornis TaxID=44386 RepID=A0A9J6G036_HAELO|nr:hypothetical protein HPB48_019862 [Haemaphysalis longicornis]